MTNERPPFTAVDDALHVLDAAVTNAAAHLLIVRDAGPDVTNDMFDRWDVAYADVMIAARRAIRVMYAHAGYDVDDDTIASFETIAKNTIDTRVTALMNARATA